MTYICLPTASHKVLDERARGDEGVEIIEQLKQSEKHEECGINNQQLLHGELESTVTATRFVYLVHA
jgi:hypothetical protein